MRNGNLLKSRVSEIHVKRICVNQGVGVVSSLLALFTTRMASQMKTKMIEGYQFNYYFAVHNLMSEDALISRNTSYQNTLK